MSHFSSGLVLKRRGGACANAANSAALPSKRQGTGRLFGEASSEGLLLVPEVIEAKGMQGEL